jgi:predicted PurR-regulated permease PerM
MPPLPLSVRRAIELMGVYFLGMIILAGSDVITPIVTAFFLAVMLLPVNRFLRRKKVPETLAIFLSILFLAIIIGLLVWFFSSQISQLISDFPQIKKNVQSHLNTLSQWVQTKWGMSTQKQVELINKQNEKVFNVAGGILSGAAASVTGTLIFIGLLPIYIFLILFYKNLLIRFVFIWFPQQNQPKVEEAIRETEVIIKSYLIGY